MPGATEEEKHRDQDDTERQRVMRKRVLVLGGNFGGLTAAITIKHELHGDVDVTVVSSSDEFLFTPSLIWVPFGKRHGREQAPTVGRAKLRGTVAAQRSCQIGEAQVLEWVIDPNHIGLN